MARRIQTWSGRGAGTEIEVRAVGVDAAEAVAALEALTAGKFDEDQNEDQNGG